MRVCVCVCVCVVGVVAAAGELSWSRVFLCLAVLSMAETKLTGLVSVILLERMCSLQQVRSLLLNHQCKQ